MHGSLQYTKSQAESCHDLPQQLLCNMSIYRTDRLTVVDYAMIKWNKCALAFYKYPEICTFTRNTAVIYVHCMSCFSILGKTVRWIFINVY